MDANVAAQEAEIPRQAKAFDYSMRERESGLEDDEMRREMGRREATYGRQRELASGKEARNAKVVAREGTRAATHGQESRERSVQQRYDPFGSMYSSGNSLATTVSPWTRQAAGGKY